MFLLQCRSLLVEEEPVHAVRVALHLHRPPPDVIEDAVGDVEVVGDQVALGQPRLGEENLVRVRDRDFTAADTHGRSIHIRPRVAGKWSAILCRLGEVAEWLKAAPC